MSKKTLRDRYPTCEPLYLVDTAITVTPKSVQALSAETGCTTKEVQKAVKHLLRLGLVDKTGSKYSSGGD